MSNKYAHDCVSLAITIILFENLNFLDASVSGNVALYYRLLVHNDLDMSSPV